MKKLLNLLVLSILLLSISSCSREYVQVYGLGNQTDKEVIIFPPAEIPFSDSIAISPHEYYRVGRLLLPTYGPIIESFYGLQAVYLKYDGVIYQIDRNDSDCCLWELNYHSEINEEIAAKLRVENGDKVATYVLTEDYIKRQIVVTKE